MGEKSCVFMSLGSHRPPGLLIFVLYKEKQCWHVQFLLSLMIFETNSAWASSLGAAFHDYSMFSKVQNALNSEEILVQEHKGLVGGNHGIPLAVLVLFYYLLIFTDLSPVLRVDSALPPTMLLILLLIISFCSFLLYLVLVF